MPVVFLGLGYESGVADDLRVAAEQATANHEDELAARAALTWKRLAAEGHGANLGGEGLRRGVGGKTASGNSSMDDCVPLPNHYLTTNEPPSTTAYHCRTTT